MKFVKVNCNDIKIGERIRDNLGDISSLVDNIKENGLMSPIGITKDNELVFGERRLTACKELDYEEIDCVIVNSTNIFKLECAENIEREGFTMSQRVKLRVKYKEIFMQEKAEMVKKGIKVQNLHLGKMRNRLAGLSGVSHDTAKKEDTIIKFADQKIIDKVDKKELSVNKAYALVEELKEESKTQIPKIDNEIDTLPVEEPVEEPVDTPIEPVQADDSACSVTISDTNDGMVLPEQTIKNISYWSEKTKMAPWVLIEYILKNTFDQWGKTII